MQKKKYFFLLHLYYNKTMVIFHKLLNSTAFLYN